MSFSSSVFPPAPHRPMAAGREAVRRPPFGSSSPASCPRGCRFCLVPFIRFEADGTGSGAAAACLDIVMWLIVSRRLIYIMNMIYAMYIKDTRIQ